MKQNHTNAIKRRTAPWRATVLFAAALALGTAVEAQELFNEQFTGGVSSTGFTVEGGYWDYSNPGSRQITGAGFDADFAIFDQFTVDLFGAGSLISAPFDASVAGTYTLEFDEQFRCVPPDIPTVWVQVWNGTAWTEVFAHSDESNGYPNPAISRSFDITAATAGAALAQVRFFMSSSDSYMWWALDNIKVTRSSCTPPVASATLVPDPANGQFSVAVNLTSLGNATSVDLVEYVYGVGEATVYAAVTNLTTYVMGPYSLSDMVYLRVAHHDTNDDQCHLDLGHFNCTACPNTPTVVHVGDPPLEQGYCSADIGDKHWNYVCSDPQFPLQITFTGGAGIVDRLRVYDGTDTTGVLLYNSAISNPEYLDGISVTALSGSIYMDRHHLSPFSWFTCYGFGFEPWNWNVSAACMGAATAMVEPDCPNFQFNVNVDITDMGGASLVYLVERVDGAVADTVYGDIANIGTYVMGPYNSHADTVNIHAIYQTGDYYCMLELGNFIGQECVSCGTKYVDHTYCYVDNENKHWKYSSVTGLPLELKFTGYREACCDILRIFDGSDTTGTLLFNSLEYQYPPYISPRVIAPSGSIYMDFHSNGSDHCNDWPDQVPFHWYLACPPSNDDCANAIEVGCNSVTHGTTYGANDADAPPQISDGTRGVWYKTTGTGQSMTAGTYNTVNTDNPYNISIGWQTSLGIYTGTCGNLSLVEFAQSTIVPPFNNSITWYSTLGTTYYIYVSGRVTGEEGLFDLNVSCAEPCTGDEVVVNITTGYLGSHVWWNIRDTSGAVVANMASGMHDYSTYSDLVCLDSTAGNCYTFHLATDIWDYGLDFGDGLFNGGWELRTADGDLILQDAFANGSQSPSATPAWAGYGSGHPFCLPLGPANIASTECGIFTNGPGNKVFCNKVTGATLYQFEFSDPDAGYTRRQAMPTNRIHFWDLDPYPLTPGVTYFARVRTNVAGPLSEAHFGSGCEMGLAVTVPCSQLISAPNYGHSCNETREFGRYGFIYATPVAGADAYEFRIYNLGEGYDQTFTRSTYILHLKWPASEAPGLANGSTYNVDVNVINGGVESGFCGTTCTITIQNAANFAGQLEQTSFGAATLWPNPVRDGQVHLNIDGLSAGSPSDDPAGTDQHITVKVQDIYGKQVFAQEFGNSGDRFSTILNLSSDIASGIYMVNITVNGNRTVQRLSIIR